MTPDRALHGIVKISDLEVMTHIGVPDAERMAEQKLLVSIECVVTHASTDDVSVDYQKICEAVKELSKMERKTVEKFCDDIGQMLEKDFDCREYEIETKKFILSETKYVSYTLSTR